MKRQQSEPSTFQDPPEDFAEWWNPSRRDKDSGADVGGHPDAQRLWARKDPGRWVHRTYGINARIAWNTQSYRSQYLQWVQLGRPDREPIIMVAQSLEQQKQFWNQLKLLLNQIPKLPVSPHLPLCHKNKAA